ncbi:AmmeMemoRadiSam system protein B [Candidatus Uhrbacteria bacterium]|nr:AmmeMemoRadiSam system protein B [Candidatus Uhrbacteria bacterium]
MICFAAITPHTPLLIPSVGKENTDKLKTTVQTLTHLAQELYASSPDTLVILSSHATQHEKAFSLNLHDEYQIDLKDFGDLTTHRTLKTDLELSTTIGRIMEEHQIPFTLDSNVFLDYGTGVPTYLLTQHLPRIHVVPVTFSRLSRKDHVRFGTVLKEVFENTTKRIAVIASGDLSHCLSSDAPLGFRPEGQEYTDKLLEAIKGHSIASLLSMPEELVQKSEECLYQQLLILLGIFEHKHIRPEILSYEAPFGVGYLVVQFHLSV